MALQDINIGAAPNDKTGTPARQAGQMINQNFHYLEDKIVEMQNPDAVLKKGDIETTGLDVHVDADAFEWRIAQVDFMDNPEFDAVLDAATTGYYRKDLLLGDDEGGYHIYKGEEDPVSATEPNLIPNGTIKLGVIDVYGGSISGTEPIDLSGYASKDYVDSGLSGKLNIADYNDRFKGKFTSLANLEAAYPTANVGDSAQVDEGVGFEVLNYNWDAEEGWVQGGSGSSATNTDALPEGSSNLYFTTARVLATVLTGISFATGGAIVSTDSVLVAFGKLQKQITDALTAIGLKQDLLVSGTNIKTLGGFSLLGAGNINVPVVLVFDNAPKTPLTGTTSATILASYVIPANTIPANSILRISCRLIKTGTAGTMVLNINNDGSGAGNGCRFVNGVISGASAASTYMAVKRDASLRAGNATILSNSGTFPTDTTNGGYSVSPFDTTVSQTIYVWGALNNATDTLNFEHLVIEILH